MTSKQPAFDIFGRKLSDVIVTSTIPGMINGDGIKQQQQLGLVLLLLLREATAAVSAQLRSAKVKGHRACLSLFDTSKDGPRTI